jgi:hypothetical protein
VTAAPTKPGWYQYSGDNNVLMFLLTEDHIWYAISDNGENTKCDWGYIEQALGVYDLKMVAGLNGAVRHSVFDEAEGNNFGNIVDPREAIRGKR